MTQKVATHWTLLAFALAIFVHCSASECVAQQTFKVSETTEASLRETFAAIKDLRNRGNTKPVLLTLPSGTFSLRRTLEITPELVGDGLRIRAEKTGNVILSGSQPLIIGGCETRSSGLILWSFLPPEDFAVQSPKHRVPRVLIVDGAMKSAARSTDQYHRIEKALADRRSGFVVPSGVLPNDFELGDHICDLVLLHDWSSSRMPVRSYRSNERELRSWGPMGCSAPHYAIDHFEKQPRFWLEGHPSFVDSSGDWYFDRKRHEILVVANEEKSGQPSVLWPRLRTILQVSGTEQNPLKNLSIEGIRFSGSRFAMPAGGMASGQATTHEIRNDDGSRASNDRQFLHAAVNVTHAEGIAFKSCEFTDLGASGLWIGQQTRDCRVSKCRFDRIGGNAVNIGEDNRRRVAGRSWFQAAPEQVPSRHVVDACTVQHCGQMMPGSVGIWAGLNRELEIAGNTIRDCPYSGISLGWIWNNGDSPAAENHIHGNRIDNVMQVLSDGGGIYTLGQQRGTRIEGNRISDIRPNAGKAESNAIFFDQGSQGMKAFGNTIRRVAKSPLRFHQAGKNEVLENAWELNSEVPAVRFNNTDEANITLKSNRKLPPEKSYFTIGNSLTWDTVPSRLDGNVHWHVDCGKSLPYIRANPEDPCVGSSRRWPTALTKTQYDYVSCQAHYGATLKQDVATISKWMKMQPSAIFVIHSGWARSKTRASEYAIKLGDGEMTHSPAYINSLLSRLQELHPGRTLRQTHAIDLLELVSQDIKAGRAPISDITDLYRDAIHMTVDGGRYLMHNAMRIALQQPRSRKGFEKMKPELQKYLDSVLDRKFGNSHLVR